MFGRICIPTLGAAKGWRKMAAVLLIEFCFRQREPRGCNQRSQTRKLTLQRIFKLRVIRVSHSFGVVFNAWLRQMGTPIKEAKVVVEWVDPRANGVQWLGTRGVLPARPQYGIRGVRWIMDRVPEIQVTIDNNRPDVREPPGIVFGSGPLISNCDPGQWRNGVQGLIVIREEVLAKIRLNRHSKTLSDLKDKIWRLEVLRDEGNGTKSSRMEKELKCLQCSINYNKRNKDEGEKKK
ncbi:hypothetical protein Acr_24g0005510 [Actinidia rufa]|uniref:Uncharacterized protein n=1 Tax=Actinidia rufa TaxID=165716 RepID=A0A7J0GUF0_9ERIC|nr:hypothetical protein Acr_24g0005510 [Actinidia rufa]